MASAVAVTLGILAAAGGALLVGYAAGTKAPAAPAKPAQSAWIRAQQLNPGDVVRVAIAPGDLATVARAFGVQPDLAGLQTILASPTVTSVLSYSGTVLVWMPGDANLPADWPPDDPAVATNIHAQFVYAGSVPMLVTFSPIPFIAWIKKGIGAVLPPGGGVVQQAPGFGGGFHPIGTTPGGNNVNTNPVIVNSTIPQPPATTSWTRVITGDPHHPAIAPANVWLRGSMSPAQVASYLFQGGAPTGGSGFQQALALRQLLQGLSSVDAATVLVWPPADPSTPGFPWDDPAFGTNYHVQYKTKAPITIGSMQDAEWMGT